MADYLTIARAALKRSRTETLPECRDGESSETGTRDHFEASRVLVQAGIVRLPIGSENVIGIWADLDGPVVRKALAMEGAGETPVLYLDGSRIPIEYKTRRVPGEPVPLSVLVEMERNPLRPWEIRDRLLAMMRNRVTE